MVSAGGTREELDPVRFLGNWSSGRQGYALAATAAARGAKVTLVAANVTLADPAGARVLQVTSAAQLRDAVLEAAARTPTPWSWPPRSPTTGPRPGARTKIKKTAGRAGADPPGARIRTSSASCPAAGGGRARSSSGSRAETGDLLGNGRAKLAAKGCDLLVVNQVGAGLAFGAADNEAVILAADGTRTPCRAGPRKSSPT